MVARVMQGKSEKMVGGGRDGKAQHMECAHPDAGEAPCPPGVIAEAGRQQTEGKGQYQHVASHHIVKP